MLLWGQRRFSATQIPGLTAWFDFSNSAYLTLSATAITQALDRSGNGNHTNVQATGTKRPTFASNQLNGLSLATFDNGDTLISQASGLLALANGANTAFIVCKNDNASGVTDYVFQGTEAGGGRYYLRYSPTAGNTTFLSRSSDASAISNTAGTNNIYQIIRARRSGTTQALAVAGGTEATNANGLDEAGVDTFYIGSRADTDSFLAGGIGEMIFYNRSLSTAEILQVEIYLANKWGLYHPNATWIGAYTPLQQALIHAWKLNKDDAFTSSVNNPFALIIDAQPAALGTTTSLTDYSGMGNVLSSTSGQESTNTATYLNSRNAFVTNGTSTEIDAGSSADIDDIFAAGGTCIAVIRAITSGENDVGRIFDTGFSTGGFSLFTHDTSAGATRLRTLAQFNTADGDWETTARDLTLSSVAIVAVTYNAAATTNDPVIYINSITAKGVTESVTPVGAYASDAALSKTLLNRSDGVATFNGGCGCQVFLKSIMTDAQRTSLFTSLATIYGVTLT